MLVTSVTFLHLSYGAVVIAKPYLFIEERHSFPEKSIEKFSGENVCIIGNTTSLLPLVIDT